MKQIKLSRSTHIALDKFRSKSRKFKEEKYQLPAPFSKVAPNKCACGHEDWEHPGNAYVKSAGRFCMACDCEEFWPIYKKRKTSTNNAVMKTPPRSLTALGRRKIEVD